MMTDLQPEPDPVPVQRALQLAVRVERSTPPSITDLCEAAVLATIALLDDERSRPGGVWHDAVTSWNGARIRKIVRRGRGSAWDRAQEPDGVTVQHRTAEVRAYVPGPVGLAPAPIAKLQIQSTPLTEPERSRDLPAPGPRSPELLIALTPAVEMSWGKRAAQCAHAGQLAWQAASVDDRARWDAGGRPLRVIHPTPQLWDDLVVKADIAVHDGGFTEVAAGTLTAVALWRTGAVGCRAG